MSIEYKCVVVRKRNEKCNGHCDKYLFLSHRIFNTLQVVHTESCHSPKTSLLFLQRAIFCTILQSAAPSRDQHSTDQLEFDPKQTKILRQTDDEREQSHLHRPIGKLVLIRQTIVAAECCFDVPMVWETSERVLVRGANKSHAHNSQFV